MRFMTVFLFVLIQKKVKAPFADNVLVQIKVMWGASVKLLSFGTREYVVLICSLKEDNYVSKLSKACNLIEFF